MLLLRALALLTFCAPIASAQQTYTLTLDPNRSAGTWGGTSIIGSLTNTTPYQFDGTMELRVANPVPPFGSGEVIGGSLVSIPRVLTGEVPNPIPGLPPLADVELRDMDAVPSTVFPFQVDPSGFFTSTAILTFQAGEVIIDPPVGGAFTIPLAGFATGAFTLDGTITQVGPDVVFESQYDLQWNIGIGGLAFLGFNRGDAYGTAPAVGAGMTLQIDPLFANQSSDARLSNGTAGAQSYLVYSISGLGSTPVPALNLVLDILNPVLAAGPTAADANGNVTWTLSIPNRIGFGIWFQGMQFGATTNVPFEVIQ